MEQQAELVERCTPRFYLELLAAITLVVYGPNGVLPWIFKSCWQALLRRVSEYEPLTISLFAAAALYASLKGVSWLLGFDPLNRDEQPYSSHEFPGSSKARYGEQQGRYAEQQQQRRYREPHRQQQQQQRQREENQRQQQQQHSDKWEGMMGFGSQKPPAGCRGAVLDVLTAADHYQVLRLTPSNLNPENLKQARKLRALEVHPDKAGIDTPGTTQSGQRVNLAFDTLSDPVARREYDEWLAYKRPHPRTRPDSYTNSGSGGRPSSSSSSTGQANGRTAGGASNSSGGAGSRTAAGSGRGGGSGGSSGKTASKRRSRRR